MYQTIYIKYVEIKYKYKKSPFRGFSNSVDTETPKKINKTHTGLFR